MSTHTVTSGQASTITALNSEVISADGVQQPVQALLA